MSYESYNNSVEPKQVELKELIFQIVFFIKNKDDYESASKMMIDYNISIEDISSMSLKLSAYDISKLADTILQKSN